MATSLAMENVVSAPRVIDVMLVLLGSWLAGIEGEYADPMISDTRLTIGSQIKGMTDKDIIDVFNGVMAAQEKLLEGWDRTVTEMLPGAPQIEYRKDLDQIVLLAEVIRCYVDDGGQDGEVTVHIDGNELSLAEFGQLLKYYAGWGMRVTFVPEERLTENPTPVQQRPKKSRKRIRCSALSVGQMPRGQLRQMYP